MERERSKFDGTKTAPQAESGAADHRADEAEARILRFLSRLLRACSV